MSREAIRRAAITAAAAAAALLLCEAAVRVAFEGRFAVRPSFLEPDPRAGYRPAPGLDDRFYGRDFSIEVRTDAEGYRLGCKGDVDFGGDLVLFCGDSYVFGWGVSSCETCASALDSMLAERTGGRCRLVDLGVGGYGTWQTSIRLEEFLGRHPEASVVAVIFVHVPNDAADNARAVAYSAGTARMRPAASPARTPSHLVNMALYAWRRMREWGDGPNGRPVESAAKAGDDEADNGAGEAGGGSEEEARGLEDLLFSMERLPTARRMPGEVSLGRRKVDVSELTVSDGRPGVLLERNDLTAVQAGLIRAAVDHSHDVLRERGLKIIHTVLPTAPAWFSARIDSILAGCAESDWNDIVFAGIYPDPSGYEGPVFNSHSGGHYTPGFNRFWAGGLMRLLERTRAVGWRGGEETR